MRGFTDDLRADGVPGTELGGRGCLVGVFAKMDSLPADIDCLWGEDVALSEVTTGTTDGDTVEEVGTRAAV